MPIHVTEDTTALVALGIAALKAPTPEIALTMLEAQADILDGIAGRPAVVPMTDEEADRWLADAIAETNGRLDAILGPVVPRAKRPDDGLGRRITYAAGLREGTVLYTPKGIERFGGSAVSPGSRCAVTRATADHLYVRFEDAETGEIIEGDVDPAALRFPVAEAA